MLCALWVVGSTIHFLTERDYWLSREERRYLRCLGLERRLTVAELGGRVASKNPQYADLSDEDLGRSILQKYPPYRNLVEGEPATTTAPSAPQPLGAAAFGRVIFKMCAAGYHGDTTKIKSRYSLLHYLGLLVIPPVLLYAASWTVAWMAAGFRGG